MRAKRYVVQMAYLKETLQDGTPKWYTLRHNAWTERGIRRVFWRVVNQANGGKVYRMWDTWSDVRVEP